MNNTNSDNSDNILQIDQIERIMTRYKPNFKQQISNMKNKFKKGEISTGMSVLLMKEIQFLNQQIEYQNRLLNLDKGDIITYKAV